MPFKRHQNALVAFLFESLERVRGRMRMALNVIEEVWQRRRG